MWPLTRGRSSTSWLRARLVIGLGGVAIAIGGEGCSSSARFPTSAGSSCRIEASGADVVAARCVEAGAARIHAVRVDGAGDIVLGGTFSGFLWLDPGRVIGSNGSLGQGFVAKLRPDLSPRFVSPIDAPGTLRGIVTTSTGVTLVTSSPDSSDAASGARGPFLTQLDGAGAVSARRDLGFGGLVTGVASDSGGSLVLRVQQEGLRLVVIARDGNVVSFPRVSPGWIAQFPASVTGDALVPDIAVGRDGAYTAHAGATDDGAVSDQVLTKIGANGAVLWSRPAPIGGNAQIAALGGGGVAVLTPQAGAICPGAIGRSFAVTAMDGEANVRWLRCFAARAADLHLAVDSSGHVVVAGTMKDGGDLGDGERTLPPRSLASFVVRLGDRGETRKVVLLRGPPIVAVHAVSAEPGGGVVVAGLGGHEGTGQTHLFVVTLR